MLSLKRNLLPLLGRAYSYIFKHTSKNDEMKPFHLLNIFKNENMTTLTLLVYEAQEIRPSLHLTSTILDLALHPFLLLLLLLVLHSDSGVFRLLERGCANYFPGVCFPLSRGPLQHTASPVE
jgi:hypothetical protein